MKTPVKHTFNGLFSITIWIRWYKKDTTIVDCNEARDDWVLGWQWYRPDHTKTICTLLQTDNHVNSLSLNIYGLNALPDA